MYQRQNIPQKQLCAAALKQPLSPCKGYQKLQLSQAGQAHSLSCKGERSTWGEGSTQKSPLCQEPYEQGGRYGHFPKQLLTRCAWEGVERPGSMDNVLGDLQDHVLPGKSGTVAWAANPIHTHIFLDSPPDSSSISKVPLQQGKSIPFLLQLGNVGTSILLTFPRLLSQTGAARSWSGLLIRALITPSNPPSSFKATASAV